MFCLTFGLFCFLISCCLSWNSLFNCIFSHLLQWQFSSTFFEQAFLGNVYYFFCFLLSRLFYFILLSFSLLAPTPKPHFSTSLCTASSLHAPESQTNDYVGASGCYRQPVTLNSFVFPYICFCIVMLLWSALRIFTRETGSLHISTTFSIQHSAFSNWITTRISLVFCTEMAYKVLTTVRLLSERNKGKAQCVHYFSPYIPITRQIFRWR